jgi:hypothetical protein
MIEINLQHIKYRLNKLGIHLDRRGIPFFKNNNLHGVTILTPESSPRIVSLVNSINQFVVGKEYTGSISWILDHSMWSTESNSMGIFLWNKIHRIEYANIESGILYDKEEILLQFSSLLIPLFFQWDACMIPFDGSCIIIISHDGYIDIVTKSLEEENSIMIKMKGWGARSISA